MRKEVKQLIASCQKNKNANRPKTLEEMIALTLNEDLMEEFSIEEKKRKRLREFVCEFTRKTKVKENRIKLTPVYPEIPKLDDSHKQIRYFSEKCPTTVISRFLEQDIRNMITARGLEIKYPQIIDRIMAEVQSEFLKLTHEAGVNLKSKPIDYTRRGGLSPYNFFGKTQQYSMYLKHREKFSKRWLLHYPFIKMIYRTCIETLPDLLFTLDLHTTLLDLKDLDNIFSEHLRESKKIFKNFYAKVTKLALLDKTKVPRKIIDRYMATSTGLLSVYMGQAISRTLLHIVEITGDEEKVPSLKLNIDFVENSLILRPSALDVVTIFSQFMTKLVEIGRGYLVLNSANTETEENISLFLTDEFLAECKEKMSKNIEFFYEPVVEYTNFLEAEFGGMFDHCRDLPASSKNEAKENTQKEFSFSEGLKMIRDMLGYMEKAYAILSNQYFAIGQLIILDYYEGMKQSLKEHIESIFVKLCAQHQWENEDICDSFVLIRSRALQKPSTTEELIEQGKYMVWIKGTFLGELTERIQNMLYNLTPLFDFGTLTQAHMDLNADTVNWLYKIEPILDQYSTMYEQLKYDIEERLQHTIAEVNKSTADIFPYLVLLDNMDDITKVRSYIHQIADIMSKLREINKKIIWINNEERCLGFPQSQYKRFEELTFYVYPFYHLLKVCGNLQRSVGVWFYGPFEFLNADESEEKLEDYLKDMLKMQKAYRNKIRQMNVENNPVRFQGVLDDQDFLNWPSPLKLTASSIQVIKDFRPALTLMRIMCNDALMKRHWKEMSEIAGFDMTPNAGTTLQKLVDMNLEADIEKYEVISSGATKERELLTNLRKMQAEWVDIYFKTSNYKDTTITILTQLDDVQVVLDDHIMKTLTMRGSVFVKPYETEVRAFYEKILRMNNTIDEWGKVQAQWLYLLPIFSSKDIVSQMPEEGGLFKEVNDTYRRYMDAVARNPKVIETAGAAGVLETMKHCIELLEQINDGVVNYLEKKRLFFPRFFFLSNDEMLEILSETKDPLRVQPHLKKCFEAINKLQFDSDLKISAMYSQEGEKVDFRDIIKSKEAGGSVEKWLVQVEQQMILSVREQITKSYDNYLENIRTKWVQLWPGQIVLAVSQMFWTSNVHNALNQCEEMNIESYSEELKEQLHNIVALIRDPTLTTLSRITIKALIVIDVHAKDVVEELYKKKVKNDREFKWLSQMRYYLENEQCLVRLVNATVKYAYEYLGNTDRLVITPLTDRCYRTLIGAYHLHLNGAPEGPAGTGKTETTKDLAKAIAVQCVVFNCSDGLDYKAMGKFFKGLASCGAWACFDEFNRIDIEVLSVVAQQILSIILAVRANLSKFIFEGSEISLNPACYVCITMNPGYAGRSELPDNLKVLFRTVAMMVPDYAMIGEISLYSYGFTNARNLSVKIVTTYRLCSEQLSSQNHYDYGMRAVKSVLSAAGNLKRTFPHENEDILLLRSIIDVNLPKFLAQDIPLFEGIISDLFPGIILPKADYKKITKAVQTSCTKRKLILKDSFLLKIIQTYEMMIVRWGFMMVGEPFAGKTSTLKVLADCLTLLNKQGEKEDKVVYKILNPKAITMGQLYGQFDPVSYEWFDGVIATIFRDFSTDLSPDRKWIIFDGPVDAVWIENMNSVLDDNRKLCLMSGEVMSMTQPMSLIFEVMDLEQASPATVSRCGMIFMEPSALGWKPFVSSWIPKCNPEWCGEYKQMIGDLFDWIVPPSLEFIRKNCHQHVSPGEISLVKNMMQLVEMYLDTACEASVKKEEDFKNMLLWIQAAYIQAGVWGLGSILDTDSRVKFDEFYKQLWRGQIESLPYPKSMEKMEMMLPNEGILLDYSYIFKAKGNWKYWPEVVKSERVDEAKNILQVLVPTVDTARYCALINMHIKNNNPILLVGPTGTGKTFYIQDILMNQINKDIYEPAFITFTVKISANQTQEMIISKLNKRKRGHYGPPKGKLSVIFIDDVNMPIKEVYGAQPPLELLRQYFDHKNWYDLKTTAPIYLYDLLFLAAMGLVGGSRQEIYARFLRHFSVFSINDFSEDSMSKIYSNVLLLGWKNNGFPSDIIMVVNQTVAATLAVYSLAMNNLRPTPSKSHYVFNLRDFSRLIQGCAMLRKESLGDEKKIFSKIWVHEVLRIFYDRLIEQKDKDWFFSQLKGLVRDNFKDHFDQVFENYPKDEKGQITQDSLKSLMFGTFFDQDSTEDERRYEETSDIKQFLNLALNCLEDYNSTHKTKMDIVLFDYALEHLSKICRVLSMSCGSALLVGISGSGRQSLTKLAAVIYGQVLFQPEITKNYGLNEWRDDIKKILKESGGKGKNAVFLISEGQIQDESFLQDIDCLLNSGEVPNIYQIDEKQEILDMARLAAQGGNRNLDVSALEVFFFFTKRCREKLHIILCFSPVGSTFRNRLRLYPSLINCCTIDWFEDWPENALEEVAHSWMGDVHLSDEVKRFCVVACKFFHVEARTASADFFRIFGRKTYITSASYLELIKSFTLLTNKKQTELMNAKKRYLGGLEKLAFAAEQIAEMQKSLNELQPKLKAMSEKAAVMLKEIEQETKAVERVSNIVKEDEKIVNKQAAAAEALKKECEEDLAVALPILEDALAALDTLKPADITLVKSMKNPPAAIKLVMAAVCIIKGIKPDRVPDPATGRMALDFWGPSKKVLGDMNLLQSLKDFDKDHINPDSMNKLRKEYITNKDFKPEVVAKASSAAEGLCKWIIAMDKYDNVIKIVAPKKAKLEAAEREFQEAMNLLRAKKEQVALLEAKLANLNEQLEEATRKKQELQDDVDLCSNKLIRAQKLIGGLGGEKTRWTEAANALQDQYDSLAGDILISCGIIAYLSAFNAQLRQKCVKDWHSYVKKLSIPCGKDYDLEKVLGSDVKIQNWYINGLPRDSFSTENAIIQDSSRRCSLFIDPQSQASSWVKKHEKKNSLHVVKFSYADYMKKIETCVQLGYPVLVESIEEDLEAPLDPLLFKKTFKQAGIEVISLGESVIEYNKNFKLYMTSKLRNPHYLPEVFNKVTLINFALTIEGLQDQLLGIVVAVEKPELQLLKEELIIQKAENKEALGKVEESILKTLSECKGDILEDESAIQVLDESKVLAADIHKKQEQSVEIEKSIEEFRMKYKEVSDHSAVLYYCISDLANVDPMYQYALEWFINLYIGSIQKAEKFKEIEKRCDSLIRAFTYDLYNNVTRALFEKDKLLFSFLLCSKIMVAQHKLDEHEFMFILTGGVSVENPLENPTSWLPKSSWDEITRVDELPSFAGFRDSFVKNAKEWKAIYDHYSPEVQPLPSPWNEKLSLFQKLIIIRLLRPDKILVATTKFVQNEMDERYIKPPPFNIAVSYNDSYSLCPLIFILSPGTDPMAALVKFAEEKKMTDKFQSISLGQGQGPIAQSLIEEGQLEGLWICLQNCHLATSWMPSLEKIFESLDFNNTNDNFRLWLTSYPSNKFPVSILQKGVKMTNEPPAGLSQNLLKSYINDPVKNPEFYDGCPGKEEMFTRLLYGVAFFHAVVQERRTFGPLGWNIPYGFNDSDFDISVQQVQMFINDSDDPYEALSYLIGECNYGGRVTDDWDRRLIVTILDNFFNPKVASDTSYQFSNIANCYGLPSKSDYNSYLHHIQSLPQVHSPEVVGLHINAGITKDMQNSSHMLSSVLKAYGEMQGGSIGETDKFIILLTTDILSKLPNKFDLEAANLKYPVEYSESMNTVLVQEMARFNRLWRTINNSLVTMQKAIQGLVAMSPALEAFSNSLILAKIPSSWMSVSYPSLKNLPNYVNDFVQRMEFLNKWFLEGKPNDYWVSGFFFTQAFLTGVKQNYARRHTIAIDKLTFDFEVMRESNFKKEALNGAYVYGLFSDGARWDRNKWILSELLPKVLHDQVPHIWLKPIKNEEYFEGTRYKSPVYKTSERRGTLSTTGHSTNYVLPILLDTDRNAAHWIKRSVALLCQLD